MTHTHPDHSPLASPLAKRTGARLIGLPPPADGRPGPDFAQAQLTGDGEASRARLPLPRSIRQTRINCVCYLLEGERLLFTGDHVPEGVSPVILPPDGDVGICALDKLSLISSGLLDTGCHEHGKEV